MCYFSLIEALECIYFGPELFSVWVSSNILLIVQKSSQLLLHSDSKTWKLSVLFVPVLILTLFYIKVSISCKGFKQLHWFFLLWIVKNFHSFYDILIQKHYENCPFCIHQYFILFCCKYLVNMSILWKGFKQLPWISLLQKNSSLTEKQIMQVCCNVNKINQHSVVTRTGTYMAHANILSKLRWTWHLASPALRNDDLHLLFRKHTLFRKLVYFLLCNTSNSYTHSTTTGECGGGSGTGGERHSNVCCLNSYDLCLSSFLFFLCVSHSFSFREGRGARKWVWLGEFF